MGDFPKAGGSKRGTPAMPIKSGTPSQGSPLGKGGPVWGGPGKATGSNDKNKAH